jgi:hypothetical protein
MSVPPPKTKYSIAREYTNISIGILVVLVWLVLLAIGLHINSAPYRSAISYGYGTFEDWFMTIVSFTLTNVAMLAFLAGFLGGICSKIIATHAFTLKTEDLIKNNTDYVLFENPFISAFRGIFIFLGILSFQYISSFSDLSAINKKDPEVQTKEQSIDKIYYALRESLTDTAAKRKIDTVWAQQTRINKEPSNDTIIARIYMYNDSIRLFPKNAHLNAWKSSVRELKSMVKVPVLEDIPGMSSSGYFRFAVIISLVAFLCGYDPRLFGSFLLKIPLLTKSEMEKKEKP